MGRRARLDVFKYEDFVIFVDFLRRDRTGDDLAEEAVGH
jgi:hypothetical protein